jgi:hypothetical protein
MIAMCNASLCRVGRYTTTTNNNMKSGGRLLIFLWI